MSRRRVAALGAATALPLVWLLVFVALVVGAFLYQRGHPTATQTAPPGAQGAFGAVFVGQGITMLWITGLLIFYIRDVFRNPTVNADKRALWAVVLFLGNMIAMPVYWYTHIWRQQPRAPDTDLRSQPGQARPSQ